MQEKSSDTAKIFYLFLFSLVGLMATIAFISLMEMLMPMFKGGIWSYRISIMAQDIFIMFLPAFFLFKQMSNNPMRMLGMKKSEKMLSDMICVLLVFLVSYPAIAVVAKWNEQIALSDSLKTIENLMRQMEDRASQIIDLFLLEKTAGNLFFNLLILAVAAALAEEIFFRGALQQLLEKCLKNGHVAVWITAFVFSAIHLQFFGFFPRLLMGAILGYLFLYSRNLWMPILYHFVNNALVVLVNFFWGKDNFMERLQGELPTWIASIALFVSVLLTCFLFFIYKQQPRKR